MHHFNRKTRKRGWGKDILKMKTSDGENITPKKKVQAISDGKNLGSIFP